MKFLFRMLLLAAYMPATLSAGFFGKKKNFWDNELGLLPGAAPVLWTEAGLTLVKKPGLVYDSNYSRKKLAKLALHRTLTVLSHFDQWAHYGPEYKALWRTVEQKMRKYPADQNLKDLYAHMNNVITLAESPGALQTSEAIAAEGVTCASLLVAIGQAVKTLQQKNADQLAQRVKAQEVVVLPPPLNVAVASNTGGSIGSIVSGHSRTASPSPRSSVRTSTPISRSRALSNAASTPNKVPSNPSTPKNEPSHVITPLKAAMIFCGIVGGLLVTEFAIYQMAKDPEKRKKSVLARAFASVKESTQKAAAEIVRWFSGGKAIIKSGAPEASAKECLQAINELTEK